MTFRSLFGLAALSGSLVLATNIAQAGYTFVSTPAPASTTFGPLGGSTVMLLATTSGGVMSGVSNISVATVNLTSTTVSPPAPTDTTSFIVSIVLTITNVPGPGTAASGVISGTGLLSFTRSDTAGELSSFTAMSGMNNGATIGGVTYTLSNVTYTPPTVNNLNGAGHISVLVTPSVVPEPASMVMLGSGLVGVIGLGLRRTKKV